MKKKIATLIAGILLIGIVSAGLLDYFGRITGTVTVEGPVFYANAYENQKETILSQLGGEIKAYLLDTKEDGISSLKTFDFYLNCTEPQGSGCKAEFMKFFTTKELGIDYFYNSNWEFHTNLKILNKTNPDGNCRAYTELFRMHEENDKGVYISLSETGLTEIIPEQSTFEDMISTLDLPYTEMTPEDRFYIEYWIKCDYGEYDLRFRIGQDKTRIEVTAA